MTFPGQWSQRWAWPMPDAEVSHLLFLIYKGQDAQGVDEFFIDHVMCGFKPEAASQWEDEDEDHPKCKLCLAAARPDTELVVRDEIEVPPELVPA